jgi:UDP-N-acetylglucosamine--N-acetylmuramyl-(pentapeptide) pyrophosphoryl-undecaprenol N-acetylglucosamine transferase
MEEGLVSRESTLPFRAITAAAVRGRGPLELARNSGLIVRGTREARALIRQERPAAILGTGGYVCIPLFVAARQLGVPTMIYLPDIVPGLAVKVLARIANQVACSFEPSLAYLPRGKTIVTGYPVRPELFEIDRAGSRAAFGINDDLPVLFVYGGSRGARSINRAIEALLPDLLKLAHIIHVCGREGDETWLRATADRLPAELKARYQLFPYLHGTMVQAFGAADLAIARSGASTLAELPAAQLPAVLVPYPYVHQDENADYLVARGAAVKVADSAMLGTGDPTAGPLFREVQRLLTDREARAEMARRSAALALPDAAERLADGLLDLAMRQRRTR